MIELFTEIFKLLKLLFVGRQQRASKTIMSMTGIYDAMQLLVQEHECVHRIVVCKTENNGGIVKPGCLLYASVVHEVYKFPLVSIKAAYQREPVDEEYTRMLSDIYIAGCKTYAAKGLPDRTMRKEAYEADGIDYSEVYYIGTTKHAFFYLSIATVDDGQRFTDPATRLAIRHTVSTIKKLMK